MTPIVPVLLLAGCVAPPADAPRPAAPAPIMPAPPPKAPPPPAPLAADWRDWPLTRGTWRYARVADGSQAVYGDGASSWALRLTCRLPSRQIAIERTGNGARSLTVRTSALARTLPASLRASADAAAAGVVHADLAASDPLFDAMGFSRGRILVEGGGPAPLVLPAWPEMLRVVEDCRG